MLACLLAVRKTGGAAARGGVSGEEEKDGSVSSVCFPFILIKMYAPDKEGATIIYLYRTCMVSSCY